MTAELNIREVKDAIATASVDRRALLLRRVTDLFIVGSNQHSDEEVALFDDVINRLAVEIEISARALLAIRLAPLPHAPPKTIRMLAFDEAIEVARPVLIHSELLDDSTLVENAKKMGPKHLLAISRRRCLNQAVTDVLVVRGDQQVVLSTAENRGAKFSGTGFAVLVRRSDGDDSLAACVGSRPDIPPHLFLKLLAKASQQVRTKLEAEHPQARREVHQVVDEVAGRIQAEPYTSPSDSFETSAPVEGPHRSGRLDDNELRVFAEEGRFNETMAALSLMSELPLHFIVRIMKQGPAETMLVVARATGLSHSTVKAILSLHAKERFISESEIARCLASFERLHPATAREILRFYQARERLRKN